VEWNTGMEHWNGTGMEYWNDLRPIASERLLRYLAKLYIALPK
jgi:hypothetical protein